MKKIVTVFLLVTVFVLFFIYEALCMRNMVLNQLDVDRIKSSIPLFLFAVSLLVGCWMLYRHHKKNDLINSFIVLQLYIYLISFLHGFLNLDNYLLVFLPVIIIVFGRHLASNSMNRDFVQVLVILFFAGLVYTFFSLERFAVYYGDLLYYYSNSSYYVLYFLPLLLLNRSKIVQYGGILITILVVLVSSKRGGTIAASVGLLAFFLVERKTAYRQRRGFGFIVGVIIVLAGIYYVVNTVLTSTDSFLIDRFVDNNDSGERGRGVIFPMVFEMIGQSSFWQLCFGHGYDMVKNDNPIGLSAHNDFLEITYDIGIVGLFLLILFLYQLIRYIVQLTRRRSTNASCLAFSTGVLLTNMMVSHIFFAQDYLVFFALLYGYIVGDEELNDRCRTQDVGNGYLFRVNTSSVN